MSSTNEELSPQQKPRASPLDFRNTDLVSRLLAATPPYLYNMPIVPNSYFFSEMLRSFVAAKTESTNRTNLQQRRPRKRSWMQSRSEYYHRESPKSDKPDLNDWCPKPPSPEKHPTYDLKRPDRALELTMGKYPANVVKSSESLPGDMKLPATSTSSGYPMDKPEVNQQNHLPMMFPAPPNLAQESNHPNLMLPPPPPIWYPPLYPPPYGLDPLHFFIDLRVSGHIYDRKNGKEPHSTAPAQPIPHTTTSQDDLTNAQPHGFKQSRHTSAFSVPVPNPPRNIPMNLSSNKFTSGDCETKTKFDVKSLGFEKTCNRTGSNYIMKNVATIYRDIRGCKNEPVEQKYFESGSDASKGSAEEQKEETEEEKEKRVKDLRALIGLELVVDYMNHAKPGQVVQGHVSEGSSTDLESPGSPSVEVVACNDELARVI